MNKNYDIVILPTLYGFRNPSFIKFDDNITLLQKQIETIDDCFKNSNIILAPAIREEYINIQYRGHNRFLFYDKNENNFDSAKLVADVIGTSKYSKTLIIYNNIFLTTEIFRNMPTKTSIFVNDKKQGNLSLIIENNHLCNMFWDVGQEWSNILYIQSKKDIKKIKQILNLCHEKQFLFEGINKCIDADIKFSIHKHNGELIKIVKRNDTKNVKNSISHK